jgi:chromosome segregation ATPase
MKTVDLVMSKENEVKRLMETIQNLNERIASLNISIGAKTEALKSKDDEIKRIKDESTKSDKVIIKSYPKLDCNGCMRCPHCNYQYGRPMTTCNNCGKETAIVTYSNLTDVTSEIRKDVEKTAKKSISELENLQLDLEIKIESLERELTRKDKVANNNQEEWEERSRKRYNKLVEAHREEISDLKEELQKVKKDKTDEQLEKARKEELATLKTTIETLTKRIDELNKVGLGRRILNSIFGFKAKVEAATVVEEARMVADRIKHLSEPTAIYSYATTPRPRVYDDPWYTYGISSNTTYRCN